MTTGREEVGSEASTRRWRAAAAALATAAFLLGAAAAMADPAPTAPSPPPPPSTGGRARLELAVDQTAGPDPRDNTPPPRAHGLSQRPEARRDRAHMDARPPIRHRHRVRRREVRRPLPDRADARYPAIGGFDRRTHRSTRRSTTRTTYCYAVFTLDIAGNWAHPVTHLARNKGDATPADGCDGAHRQGRPGRRRQAGLDEPARRGARRGRARPGASRARSSPRTARASGLAACARRRSTPRVRRPARRATGCSPSTRRATGR